MKRTYTTPFLEKVEFRYSEQIAASSGCQSFHGLIGPAGEACTNPVEIPLQ